MTLNIDAQRMRTDWNDIPENEQNFLCSHPFTNANLGFYAMLGGLPGIPGGPVRFSEAYGFTAKKFHDRVVVIADICQMPLPDFFILEWVNCMAGWCVNVSYHDDNQFNRWVSENAQSNALLTRKKWVEYLNTPKGDEEE